MCGLKLILEGSTFYAAVSPDLWPSYSPGKILLGSEELARRSEHYHTSSDAAFSF